MTYVAFALYIAALVCFIAAFFGWGRGLPAGLALWLFASVLLNKLT